MLECNIPVTIARCDGTGWITEAVKAASWYANADAGMTDRGLQGSRKIYCRIPAAEAPAWLPQIGDYIIRGTVTAISSIADLQGLEFGKVVTVADNRRSTAALQHIKVIAA